MNKVKGIFYKIIYLIYKIILKMKVYNLNYNFSLKNKNLLILKRVKLMMTLINQKNQFKNYNKNKIIIKILVQIVNQKNFMKMNKFKKILLKIIKCILKFLKIQNKIIKMMVNTLVNVIQ